MPFIPRPAGRGEKLANVSIGSFRSAGGYCTFLMKKMKQEEEEKEKEEEEEEEEEEEDNKEELSE